MKETNWYDITQLAHKHMLLDDQHYGTRWVERIINFAMEVRHIEREACARTLEDIAKQIPKDSHDGYVYKTTTACAEAIRARGEQ